MEYGDYSIGWMQILVWGIAPLFGAILGGILSFWTAHTVEAKRWRRDKLRRTEDQRRDAYTSLLKIAGEIAARKSDGKQIPDDLKTDLLSVLTEIEILATPQARQVAFDFGHSFATDVGVDDEEDFSFSNWQRQREEFIRTVREELDVDKVENPTGTPTSFSGLNTMPFPMVTGVFGLVLAYFLVGGGYGGQGFLIGLFVGLAILILRAIYSDAAHTA